MNKFAVTVALLTTVVATPAFAANGGEARIELRGGYVTGSGLDDATIGGAVGYDFDLGATTFVGLEAAGDKILSDGIDMQFSTGGRFGLKLGDKGRLFAAGGYTFSDIDDVYAGAGYQHQIGENVDAVIQYRHQFSDFGDFDSVAAGIVVTF